MNASEMERKIRERTYASAGRAKAAVGRSSLSAADKKRLRALIDAWESEEITKLETCAPTGTGDDETPLVGGLPPDRQALQADHSFSAPVFDSDDLAVAGRLAVAVALSAEAEPIPMLLYCPECCRRHIDEGEWRHRSHHTHACQHCGHVWRPAIVATVGVQFLPGFRNEVPQ